MSDNTLLSRIDRIKEFDLNLLVTFEVVYLHQSVSKAASLLGVTSSAVSQSLTKLRSYFSDPLFIREGKGLVATTVAKNLHSHLSNGFQQLINSIDYFSDTSTKSKFITYSTAYAAMRVLPEVLTRIEQSQLSCEINHISADATLSSAEDILIYRKADIIFDTRPYYSFSTVTESYLEEEVVAICRKDHPRIGDELTPELMRNESSTFLNVMSEGVLKPQLDLEGHFGERTFSFSSSSIIANTAIISRSDSVGFISRWFAEKFRETFNIKILKHNFEISPVTFHITYNKSSLDNHNFVRLLDIVRESKKTINESSIEKRSL